MGNEIIAIVLGYLLGSIPSAYIAARFAVGKDIRQLGGGNVGGLNVYREVGMIPAVVVGIVELRRVDRQHYPKHGPAASVGICVAEDLRWS